MVEWCLWLFFLFMPLNATELANPVVTVGKLGSTGLLLIVLLFELIHGLPMRRRGMFPRGGAMLLLWAYCLAIAIATALNGRSVHDFLQYMVMPMSVLALWICENRSPGSFLRVLLYATVGHLIIAILLNQREVGTSGESRLSGGSHPIDLGLESAVVVVFCLAMLLAGRRWLGGILGIFGIYIMYQSLSKTAVLGTLIAVVLQVIFYKRAELIPRIIAVIISGSLVASMTLNAILAKLLGANSTDTLATGTGRTAIWAHIFQYFPQYGLYGYGYPPLHELGYRDNALMIATNQLPAENAFLAAMLLGGVGTLFLFTLIFLNASVSAIRATGNTYGFSLALLTILVVAAFYSESESGLNYLWFWLIALFSVRNAGMRDAAAAGTFGAHVYSLSEFTRGSSPALARRLIPEP